MKIAEGRTEVAVGVISGRRVTEPPHSLPAVTQGLRAFFSTYPAVLIQVHAGSGAIPDPPGAAGFERRIVTQAGAPDGWRGAAGAKTGAYRAMFQQAVTRGASVLLVVDPEEESLTPEWTDGLLRPALHSRCDLVTPVNVNRAGTRMLSAHLIAPLLTALFGASAEQPMEGTFAMSAALMRRLLARHDWDSGPARQAPELWIGFSAAAEGFRRAEWLAGESQTGAGAHPLPLHERLHRTIDSLFALMSRYESHWLSGPGPGSIDRFGAHYAAGSHSGAGERAEEFHRRFAFSHPELREDSRRILSPATLLAFDTFLQGQGTSQLPDRVWARAVYEAAGAWNQQVLPGRHVVAILVSLYWARLWSSLHPGPESPDARNGNLAGYFTALRPVLEALWTGRRAARPEGD